MVLSNDIPDHDVNVANPNDPCEIPYWIILPLNPELAVNVTEPSNLGLFFSFSFSPSEKKKTREKKKESKRNREKQKYLSLYFYLSFSLKGIIAIALDGVSVYGAQEGGGTNAVEPGANSQIQDAQYWYGHAETQHRWFDPFLIYPSSFIHIIFIF